MDWTTVPGAQSGDETNPRAIDIAVLLQRKASLAASGALTGALEADIDAHLTNLRENLQNGAVPLGGHPIEPDVAQGAVAAELALGHKQRALDVAGRAKAALLALRDELESAASDHVANVRSCLAFCIHRLEHEARTVAQK